MLTVARRARILGLALPIIGGMISQNVLNLVDTAMVGQLGDAALAGVGIASFVNFMAFAFVTGMAAGVQAMAARRKGEGADSETAVPLNGGLLLAAVISIPASAILFWLVPSFFPWFENDPEVVALGGDYLQCRLVAMVAVGMNFAFRGYWNAVDRSRLYLRTLLVMHVVNIALNYVLIFGKLGFPALGVVGAGLGTAISTFVGTAYYFWLGMKHARDAGFLRGLPDRGTLGRMLKLSGPAGLQQLLFAAGMTVLFTLIGKIGTAELAAGNVLVNLMLVAILPAIGFGIASATLVGQALGRGQVDDARGWGWDVCKLAMAVLVVLGLPGLVFPELILGVFIHNPETLALAVAPLRIVAATLVFEAVGMVLLNAHLGAGATRRVMGVSIGIQWGLQLPMVWFAGVYLGWGLTAVFAVQVIARVIQAAFFALSWKGDGWSKVEV